MHLLRINLPMIAVLFLGGGAVTYAVSSADGEPAILVAALMAIILVAALLYRDDTPPSPH